MSPYLQLPGRLESSWEFDRFWRKTFRDSDRQYYRDFPCGRLIVLRCKGVGSLCCVCIRVEAEGSGTMRLGDFEEFLGREILQWTGRGLVLSIISVVCCGRWIPVELLRSIGREHLRCSRVTAWRDSVHMDAFMLLVCDSMA